MLAAALLLSGAVPGFSPQALWDVWPDRRFVATPAPCLRHAELSDAPEPRAILDGLTLLMVPMLNPDGADRYGRRKAQAIDVNRDARASLVVLRPREEGTPDAGRLDLEAVFTDGREPGAAR